MSLESVLLKAQVFDDMLAVLFKIDEGPWNLCCLWLDKGVGSAFAAAYLKRNHSTLRFKYCTKLFFTFSYQYSQSLTVAPEIL